MHRFAAIVLSALSVLWLGAPSHASVARAAAPPPQRLILTPTSSSTLFTFEGLYPQKKNVCDFKQPKPLRAKYRGRLELVLRNDGSIGVIDALSFSNYLRGLAEVPSSWPAEALKAQVIAARSYALQSLKAAQSLSGSRGYDICSTDACQVYRGAAIELGAFGERWVQAVESTRGRVLTYNGRVLPAYYFSTSTGRTRSSFPGGTPQPWLPSVSGNDSAAPLAHWTATVTLGDLAAVLQKSDDWPGGAISSVSQSGDHVTVAGSGHSVTKLRSTIANDMNNEGPCLFPKTYPSQTGSAKHGPLPQTVPSSTYTVTQKSSTVTFSGRGWGHGVGMSQYGANYMAEAGSSATQILKHFYGPAQITKVSEPGEIRVLAADGLNLARISIEGPVRVTTETGSVLATGNLFQVQGGKTLTITRGIGPNLSPVLQISATVAELTALPGGQVTIPFTNSRSARIAVELAGSSGVVLTTQEVSYVSGQNSVNVPLQDSQNQQLPAGSYKATVVGFDGLDHVRSAPIAITIGAPTPPPSAPGANKKSSNAALVGILIGLVAVLGATGFFWRRRARASRT
jgi:stage II sporulation protein D